MTALCSGISYVSRSLSFRSTGLIQRPGGLNRRCPEKPRPLPAQRDSAPARPVTRHRDSGRPQTWAAACRRRPRPRGPASLRSPERRSTSSTQLISSAWLKPTSRAWSRLLPSVFRPRNTARSTTPCRCPRRFETPRNQRWLCGTGAIGAIGKISPASRSGKRKPRAPHSTASQDLPRSSVCAACSRSARRLWRSRSACLLAIHSVRVAAVRVAWARSRFSRTPGSCSSARSDRPA